MFNLTFRHINDVLTFYNPTFSEYFDQIYRRELEIQETTDLTKIALYPDLFL